MALREGEWYLDYLLTWNKYIDQTNVLGIYFEDMKKVAGFRSTYSKLRN